MTRYRKKPVEIEARRWDGTEAEGQKLVDWANPWGTKLNLIGMPQKQVLSIDDDPELYWLLSIPTLEGTMFVNPGDYVIKGVKDEFYPCKPDIFATTYEEID